MQVLFFESEQGTFADMLYALFTYGSFSRVQIQFSDGKRFGADLHSGRLVYDKNPIDTSQWHVEELPCYESLVRRWCDKHAGHLHPKKNSFFIRLIKGINNRHLGAIAVKEALAFGGYEDLPDFLSPNSLHEWATTWNEEHPAPYYGECDCISVPETLYWD